ncbi:MAG: hypothetical protein NC826_05010 [Candidatus Omnitrophica bacterium]|nr:hypothetical protein [Candidatus Omnitrophota bacterium]
MASALLKNQKFKNRAGQVTLEIALVFMAVVFLLIGILRIWLWSNYNIVKSESKYNESRLRAGSQDYPGYMPTPLNKILTEDWLFKGKWQE